VRFHFRAAESAGRQGTEFSAVKISFAVVD
jgi:hypothetical protein